MKLNGQLKNYDLVSMLRNRHKTLLNKSREAIRDAKKIAKIINNCTKLRVKNIF